MIQIADALAYIHGELNTVHRDIKPSNILVTDGDARDQVIVKISDFGAAKTFDPDDETSGMTTQVGTLAFKAPELWDPQPDGKRRKYHRSVDIFSEGLTFLAILQARPPHSSSKSIGFLCLCNNNCNNCFSSSHNAILCHNISFHRAHILHVHFIREEL